MIGEARYERELFAPSAARRERERVAHDILDGAFPEATEEEIESEGPQVQMSGFYGDAMAGEQEEQTGPSLEEYEVEYWASMAAAMAAGWAAIHEATAGQEA